MERGRPRPRCQPAAAGGGPWVAIVFILKSASGFGWLGFEKFVLFCLEGLKLSSWLTFFKIKFCSHFFGILCGLEWGEK